MAAFGDYEQLQQIDPAGRVWTARKTSGGAIQFAIKIHAGPKEPDGLVKARAMRKSAEQQRGMKSTGSAGWAPAGGANK